VPECLVEIFLLETCTRKRNSVLCVIAAQSYLVSQGLNLPLKLSAGLVLPSNLAVEAFLVMAKFLNVS